MVEYLVVEKEDPDTGFIHEVKTPSSLEDIVLAEKKRREASSQGKGVGCKIRGIKDSTKKVLKSKEALDTECGKYKGEI